MPRWPMPQGEEVYERLKRGELSSSGGRRRRGKAEHPWRSSSGRPHPSSIGVVFIPGASLKQTRARFANDEDFKVFLRLRDRKIVTVVLGTQYDMHYLGMQARALQPLVQHASQWLCMAPELLWTFSERDGGVQVQLLPAT